MKMNPILQRNASTTTWRYYVWVLAECKI